MKLFVLFFALLFLTITALAQLNKGQFLAGGNFRFESIKTEGYITANYKTSNVFLSPNIGYFILPKLAGGLRTDFSSYKQRSPNNIKSTAISFSPFLRYYFLKTGQKVNLYSDVGYIFSRSKFKNPAFTDYIQKGNGYYLSGGPVVFLNKHIALEFILGYRHTKIKDAGDNATNTISSGLGLQIHLGGLVSTSG